MREEILQILKEVNPNIKEGINLIESGLIDSFEVVNIVMELEEAFNIEIDAEEVVAENFESVDTIVALVEKFSWLFYAV